jgi:leader peptidase (prepilin peptidase)/N-methyltransferase
MIRILGTVFAGLLGLAFGSFLNVCLSRWPQGESVVHPRSHCRQCGRTLAWWENIPLVSWVALRGRCRTCRACIGWRYPLVEAAVAAVWALQAWQSLGALNGGSLAQDLYLFRSPYAVAYALGWAVFLWLLLALAVLDAEHLWLPDWLTLPSFVLGFICTLLQTWFEYNATSWLGSPPSLAAITAASALHCFYGILAAAGLILLIRWLYWLIRRREGIGLGDAKLMALLAAWLGLPGALLAFGLGVVLGALSAVVMLAIPAARTQSGSWALKKLPLGTFLCVGGIVSSLWGQAITAAYLRWAGF